MITFREWLREKDFYNEIEQLSNQIEIYENHNKLKFEMYSSEPDTYNNIVTLNEAIILPENIKINTYNSDELNKQFEKQKIYFFNTGDTPNVKLWARYNSKTDETEVYYSNKDKFNEIEAMIGHEMIHKAQNKLNSKFIEQAENLVKRINSRQDKMNDLIKVGAEAADFSLKDFYPVITTPGVIKTLCFRHNVFSIIHNFVKA